MTAATFDLDAARAGVAEADKESFLFVFGKQTFTIPSPKEWPITVSDLLAQGKIVDAMQSLLGEGYEDFAALSPTLSDLELIFEAVAKWQGVTPGE